MLWVLGGFLTTFVLQRLAPHGPCEALVHERGQSQEQEARRLSVARKQSPGLWLGAGLGLSVHSLLDGVALVAGITAWHLHGPAAGLPMLLAVLMHKPVDGLTLGTLMRRAGCSPARILVMMSLFALTTPLGVLLVFTGWLSQAADVHQWEGMALAWSAGMFLCIASSELLPELPFAGSARVPLWGALAAGLVLSIVPLWWEHRAEHSHEHPSAFSRPGSSKANGRDMAPCSALPMETKATRFFLPGGRRGAGLDVLANGDQPGARTRGHGRLTDDRAV